MATPGSDVYFEDSVQYWVALFPSGDTSCESISRPGRPLADLTEPFRLFLQNYPFASARMLSQHFNICATTAKEILVRDRCLTQFTRRWVSHMLSDLQKAIRVEASNELLQILNHSLDGIPTGHQS
jgi:hypothetical protein